MKTTTTARNVAEHLLWLASHECEDEPGCLTPMQLQKLLYYVQGWTLAEWGAPMFADDIEAWAHGPVVPRVWREFSGKAPISLNTQNPPPLTEKERAMVHSVWNAYKKYSAFALRDMTHSQEAPYLETYVPDSQGRCDKVIPLERMRTFFEERSRLSMAQTAQRRERALALARQNASRLSGREAV